MIFGIDYGRRGRKSYPIEIGARFGHLTIIEDLGLQFADKCNRRTVKVRCDCGSIRIVTLKQLKAGNNKSCGCTRSSSHIRHGHTAKGKTSPTYHIWASMIKRCTNPNSHDWGLYGGRGIMVCSEWALFENFLTDMGEKPEGLTLDRIDPNGNYCPENCRWATLSEQARNKRNSFKITFKGITLPLFDWAERLGLKPTCLQQRLGKLGWSIEMALTTPQLPRGFRIRERI